MLTNEQRERLATRNAAYLVGPVERRTCALHGHEVLFRWAWDPARTAVDGGHPREVRSCPGCLEEPIAREASS